MVVSRNPSAFARHQEQVANAEREIQVSGFLSPDTKRFIPFLSHVIRSISLFFHAFSKHNMNLWKLVNLSGFSSQAMDSAKTFLI